MKPFAVLSVTSGPLSPHVNVGYQWNGESVLAGDVAAGARADVPDRLLFAAAADYGASDRFSVAFEILAEHSIRSSRIVRDTFDVVSSDGIRHSFDDILFERASFTTFNGAAGLKVSVATDLLVAFNLRFGLAGHGLAARLTPLLGFEYGF